jgi:hypothetical protein
VWEGSLGLDFFEEVVNEFPVERKREFTITAEKIGQNTCLVRTISADVHRGDGWRSSFSSNAGEHG